MVLSVITTGIISTVLTPSLKVDLKYIQICFLNGLYVKKIANRKLRFIYREK